MSFDTRPSFVKGALRAPAAALTLAVVAIAGCGGGGPSHGAFVKHADAVCSAYDAGTKELARPKTYAQIVAFVDRTLPLYEAALQALRALEPPRRDVPAVRAWLAADRRVATALRTLGAAAERRDFPSVTAAAANAERAGERSRAAAAGLGLHVCARLVTGR